MSEAKLARIARQQLPWEHYRNTAVEFDGHDTLYPLDDGAIGGKQLPLGPLHVITAIQPDGEPDSPDSRGRLDVLDRELQSRGIRSIPAVGASFDDTHREESRAVFGLDDDEAPERFTTPMVGFLPNQRA